MAKLTLTPQQSAVVENRGGSLLVSAAAGSGKTKVLVERLFHYLTEDHCNVDDFLIITYTKAAAAELRSKIAAELSKRLAEAPNDRHLKKQLLRVYRADIKTVDSFCTALLRENTHLLADPQSKTALTPDFRVLDEGDAQLIRQRVLNRTLESFYENLDPAREQLADTLGAGRDDYALAELVLELYEKIQSHAYPAQWLAENREIWLRLGVSFDETPYAQALLSVIRRKALHWECVLQQGILRAEGDSALAAGFGEKFEIARVGVRRLTQVSCWESARDAFNSVEFPRLNTPRGRKDDPDVMALKRIWDSCKADIRKIGDVLDVSGEEAMEDLYSMAPAMLALLDLTADFSAAYQSEKLRMNAADFSDQEHLALKLLVSENGEPTALGEQLAARYTEVLVDEYQDTNEVQNAIFRAVSRDGNNIFTVGDVKQSIYRFRLADPTIFLEKYHRFKPHEEAGPGEERKITLSKNFRSRREILDAANFVFENILSEEMGDMVYGEEEALHFGAEYYPERTDCETEFHLIFANQKSADHPDPVKKLTAEARFVAKRIKEMLDSAYPVTESDGSFRPCRPEDIVILMRSPGSRSAAFAAALSEQEIPCSFEESGDFFHTMEISVMLSFLEVLDNPRQDVPLISVLRSPVFGFSADRLAEIRGKTPEGDFYDAVSTDGGDDCNTFLKTLDSMRTASRHMGIHRLLWHIYNRLNLLGIFGAMDHGAVRRENLIALSQHAETYESGGYRGLFDFVTHLRKLLESERAPITRGASAVNGVQMMSIHKSKGLEFPVVILADLDHGFSRQDFDTAVLVHPKLGLGPRCIDLNRKIRYPTLARLAIEETLRRENLAEEQRILYVAMTRPKEKLILVDSMYHGVGRLQKLAAVAACPSLPETVAAGKNFGDWILLPLLCRPEAAPLRSAAEMNVEELYTADTKPWKVKIHNSETFRRRRAVDVKEETIQEPFEFDPNLLTFEYPYQAAATTPAKITATQLKGRKLDEEIAENTQGSPDVFHLDLRQPVLQHPRFWQQRHGLTPAEKGTAVHLALQGLDFSRTDAKAQIEKMCAEEKLTKEQMDAVDCAMLEAFLRSPLAGEIRAAQRVWKEFPFMCLVDAAGEISGELKDDQILLQGVVDCFFETEDGCLSVIDFKTDYVRTEADLNARARLYESQIKTYSTALEIVFEKKVKRRILYFLYAGKAVEV